MRLGTVVGNCWPTIARSLPRHRVFPRAAYDTHDQCEEARARQEQMQEQKKPDLPGIYTCLPDTVDPRGPKGSVR